MANVNGTLRSSVLVNMIGRYSNIVIQLLVTAILARTLNPSEFGLVAVVGVIAIFLSFLSEMGLGPAIVQFNELCARQLAGLFWLTVAVGIITALALALSGPAIALFYSESVYKSIAKGIALNVAFSCWAIVPLALLRKQKEFRKIAGIEVLAALGSGICAVWSAIHGGGVNALVLKGTSNALFIFLFSFALVKPSLRSPTLARMSHVFSYSSYQFFFNLVNYFTRNVDKLLIGKFMGAVPLGFYDMSYRLMMMPIANLTHVVTPAIQPIYAEHANNSEIIFNSYQKLIRVLALGGAFVGALCVGCAPEIILLSYGAKWDSAISIFSILSISIMIQVILSSTGSVFQALGKTNLLFITGVFSTITTVSAISIGLYMGKIEVLSALVVVSFIINALQGFFILSRYGFGRSIFELFSPSSRALAIGVCLELIALMLRAMVSSFSNSLLLCFIIKAILIGGVYFGMISISGDALFLRRAFSLKRARLLT